MTPRADRDAALTALKVGAYLAVAFALLAAWLIHWATGLFLFVILVPLVLLRFRSYWKDGERKLPP